MALPPSCLSIIVPTLNERETLPCTLPALLSLEGVDELLFADGGSTDGTVEWLRENGQHVLECACGRGAQLVAAVAHATGDILCFIHADCIVETSLPGAIRAAIADGFDAGVCSIQFSGIGFPPRFMTWLYPLLGRAGLYYGDAGIFVRRGSYESNGGFRALPLFEDLDFVSRLRKDSRVRFVRISSAIVVSARRFQGWRFPVVFARWLLLQCLFSVGVPPRILARMYAPVR